MSIFCSLPNNFRMKRIYMMIGCTDPYSILNENADENGHNCIEGSNFIIPYWLMCLNRVVFALFLAFVLWGILYVLEKMVSKIASLKYIKTRRSITSTGIASSKEKFRGKPVDAAIGDAIISDDAIDEGSERSDAEDGKKNSSGKKSKKVSTTEESAGSIGRDRSSNSNMANNSSQGNRSTPQSPIILTPTNPSTYNSKNRSSRKLKRRSLGVGTIPYNHTISHTHQLHPVNFRSSYNNHYFQSKASSLQADLEEEESDIATFRKLYPHIRTSPISKLCLPPTCQHIPMTRQNSTIGIGKDTKKKNRSFSLSTVNKWSKWSRGMELLTKFLFLFLPSGGSIIYKMLFRKGGYQLEKEIHNVNGVREDEDEEEDDTDANSIVSHKSFDTAPSVILNVSKNVTASNPNPIGKRFREEKKIECDQPKAVSLLSVNIKNEDEHKEDPIEAKMQKRSYHLESTQKSPSSSISEQKDSHKPYRIRSQNFKQTFNSSYYPHVSSIFPPSSGIDTSVSNKFDDLDTNSLFSVSSNMTADKGNYPTDDPPMNFFDAETSSDAIDSLAQKLPVLPDRHGYILGDVNKSSTPLLVFVNSRSGPQQGHLLLNQLKRLLNPIQVWDLAHDGDPEVVLESFSVLKNLRILVCGGDGTVSWILSTLGNMLKKQKFERWPPVAILPLGTGNDLARIHGWGGGYSNESLLGILNQVKEAYVSLLDRWDLTIANKKGKIKVQKCFTNYVGVGVDAQVSFQMHMLRESEPKLFFSRAINKAWYGLFGAEDAFKATNAGLSERITLIADGVEIPLPPDSQGIVFLNINSYSGGASLWSREEKRRHKRRNTDGDHEQFGDGYGLTFPFSNTGLKQNLRSRSFLVDRVDSADDSDSDHSYLQNRSNTHKLTLEQKFRKVTACDLPSSCQDGLLDVVSVRSAIHLGQIRVGLSNAQKICQCREAIITTKKAVALHTDGEPWKQDGPSTFKITRKNDPAIMLHKAADDGGGTETEMVKLLDWAEDRRIINRTVHSALMKEFSRRIEIKTRQKKNHSQENLIALKRAISSNNF